MKTFIVLFGIFFTCASARTEVEMVKNFTRSYEACLKSMNPSKEILENLQSVNPEFENPEISCFIYCIAEKIGIMNDVNVSFERVKTFLISGDESPKSIETFMELMKKECPTDGEQPKDKCAVAGKYAKCMKDVQTKMIEMTKSGK